MATAAVPDGVVVEVAGATDSSPSQERLTRIAAMLQNAEQMMASVDERGHRQRRQRRDSRLRPAA